MPTALALVILRKMRRESSIDSLVTVGVPALISEMCRELLSKVCKFIS